MEKVLYPRALARNGNIEGGLWDAMLLHWL